MARTVRALGGIVQRWCRQHRRGTALIAVLLLLKGVPTLLAQTPAPPAPVPPVYQMVSPPNPLTAPQGVSLNGANPAPSGCRVILTGPVPSEGAALAPAGVAPANPGQSPQPDPLLTAEIQRMINEAVGKALAEQKKTDDAQKKIEDKDGWITIGKDFGMHAVWKDNYAWLETNDGAFRVHVGGRAQLDSTWGVGMQYDAPDQGQVQLLGRWEFRNGAPPSLMTQVGQAILNGHNQEIVVPEFLMVLGPLSIQGEWLGHHLDGVTSFTTQSQGTVTGVPNKSYFSQSGYVSIMYFLTGENRPYSKTGYHTSGAAPWRIVPNNNFYWLPGGNLPNPFSAGAWQVGVRYSYNDLSNNGIYGGQWEEVTLGVNWFWNPNMKIQWNYDIGYRGQLGPTSNSNGTFQGFGMRFAMDF